MMTVWTSSVTHPVPLVFCIKRSCLIPHMILLKLFRLAVPVSADGQHADQPWAAWDVTLCL